MLDQLLEKGDAAWWDGFFRDRTKACPFFVDWPDETLVNDVQNGVLLPGRVLELGCGNGRNAVYMRSQGCSVDAVDFSEAAITWARDRAEAAGQSVNYIQTSIFELEVASGMYDTVYDSGCFHHIAPHRRGSYLELVSTVLKPGGVLSLICFCPAGGSGLTDMQVYEQRTLGGGLGYSEQGLRHIFGSRFQFAEIRRMRNMRPEDELFGQDFLWAARMVRG
jgi:SAM-dependent methyltransferase